MLDWLKDIYTSQKSIHTGIDVSTVSDYREMQQLELHVLGIPEDLSGKVVLEMFSGTSPNIMMRDFIVERGGKYFSLDLHPVQTDKALKLVNSEGQIHHLVADATVVPIKSDSVGGILMHGVPLSLLNMGTLLSESLRVLRHEKGNFITIIPVKARDVRMLTDIASKEIPSFHEVYDLQVLEYDVQGVDKKGMTVVGKKQRAYGVKIVYR